MTEQKTFITQSAQRLDDTLLPLAGQPAKVLDAVRVMCAPDTEKIAIRRAAALLTATILSRVPYARRSDIRDAVIRAGWEMAQQGRMPGHSPGMPRGFYAGRCAARFMWFFETSNPDGSNDQGKPSRQRSSKGCR